MRSLSPPSALRPPRNSSDSMENGASHGVDIGPSTLQSGATAHPVEVNRQQQPRRTARWCPWLVPAFVVANVAVFVVTMYVNDCPKNTGGCLGPSLGRFSFQPLKENPLLGPSSTTLLKMGALDEKKVVYEHQGWRIIACIWLHGGVFHLLANMIGLLFIGIRLEQDFGFVRIGLLYVLSGVGGSLVSALFVESGISVGASGALFGLLGGMLSELIINWTIYTNKFAAFTTLIFIIAINLAIGLLPRVDNFAHIGGFVSGFLLGFVFLIQPQFGYVNKRNLPSSQPFSTRKRHMLYQYILWILAATLLIIGFVVGFVLLLRGVDANKHCSWCHYLNCIPSSKWSCREQAFTCNVTSDHSLVTLECQTNGKSRSYSQIDLTTRQINSLCTQLCS